MGHVLPVSARDWQRARQILLAREVAMIVVPLGMLGVLLLDNAQRFAALTAAAAAFAAIPLVDWMSSFSHRYSRLGGLVIAIVFSVLAHYAVWAAAVGVAATALISLSVGWGERREQEIGGGHG